jgi:hypothetical protein
VRAIPTPRKKAPASENEIAAMLTGLTPCVRFPANTSTAADSAA